MKKARVEFSVPRATVGCLQYFSVGHSGTAPIQFLRPIIREYDFGVLVLGLDGPSLLDRDHAAKSAEAMNREGIGARVVAGFLWLEAEAARRVCDREWFTCEGSALVLTKELPDPSFACSPLPDLSGVNKHILASEAISVLDGALSANDIYVHDDFTEVLIVTKNGEMLDDVAHHVEQLR